jgi:hypothetical protein
MLEQTKHLRAMAKNNTPACTLALSAALCQAGGLQTAILAVKAL